MKKGYIRIASEVSTGGQMFGIFTEERRDPVTTHYCSNSSYAEYDLLRHDEVKEFDIIYGLKRNIVYMNGEIEQSVKDNFNDAENLWRATKYGTPAPLSHTV